MFDALVIGAGPAGLMAAEELARAGRKVLVCEGKPSPARKFLMAGKSGLNITKDEGRDDFIAAYRDPWLAPMIAAFGPSQVVIWARGLGQEVFTGSSDRVFPKSMKASPLLRAWLRRLEGMGVELRTRWRWTGFEGDALRFDTPEGVQSVTAKVTVLALGGASWARLGSDAAWAPWLAEKGVEIAPFQPANMGFAVDWSPHMAKHFGAAIKGAMLITETRRERGEFVISARGIEGGGIYAISRELREGGSLRLDLMPDVTAQEIVERLYRMKPSETMVNKLRKLGLAPAAIALVMEFGRALDPVAAVKSLPIALNGPRPIDEAISTAGGVTQAAVTDGLELRAIPGVFVCGEMLDWEAPTGGYLLTGAWATGRWAGIAAARVKAV